MASESEWAWAAGIFEGEGSMSFHRGGLAIQIGMTDGDVIRRFHEVVGYGTIRVREEMRQPHWKACWYWECRKQDDVPQVMERLLPWLGERRTARWHELKAQRDALRPEKPCPQCGEIFKPKRSNQITCGHDCSWRYSRRHRRYGGKEPMTEETRARMSAGQKRRYAAAR